MEKEVPAIESKADESLQSLAELQKELAKLDRQWVIEQEKYKMTNRGGRFIPEPGSGTILANIAAILGVTLSIVYACLKGTFTHPSLSTIWPPLCGICVFVSGLFVGQTMNDKADAFLVAKEGYQLRRSAIEAKILAAK